MKYRLIDKTLKEVCWGIGCPAIYERTPESQKCGIGPCPGIHETEQSTYLIIGKKVTEIPSELEGKIGPDELLIEVPKRLIDDIDKQDWGGE